MNDSFPAFGGDPISQVRLLLLLCMLCAVPAGAKTLDGDALLAAVDKARAARREQVKSLRADVVIGLASESWSGAGTCQGRVAARRPDSLRLLGYAAVATVFDATTDGDKFWLYLPMLERAITGKAEQESLLAALPIMPTEIVGALFGEPYGAPEHGLPNADRVMEQGLILPSNHSLGDDDIDYIWSTAVTILP